MSHLKAHVKEGIVITCPFQKCGKTFRIPSTFTAHVSRSHKNWDVVCIDGLYKVDARLHAPSTSDMCDTQIAKHTDEITESDVSLVHCGDAMEREPDAVDSLLHKLARWLMNLAAKSHIPSSIIQTLVEDFRDIHDISMNIMIDQMQKKFLVTATWKIV
jgi:hypothetical protein